MPKNRTGSSVTAAVQILMRSLRSIFQVKFTVGKHENVYMRGPTQTSTEGLYQTG